LLLVIRDLLNSILTKGRTSKIENQSFIGPLCNRHTEYSTELTDTVRYHIAVFPKPLFFCLHNTFHLRNILPKIKIKSTDIKTAFNTEVFENYTKQKEMKSSEPQTIDRNVSDLLNKIVHVLNKPRNLPMQIK
jgi:hypothetical protein